MKRTSIRISERQQPAQGLAHSFAVGVPHLPNVIAALFLAGCFLVSLPSRAELPAASPRQAHNQPVAFHVADAATVGRWLGDLPQQPRADWLTGLVEFFSAVPPECRTVPNQKPSEECQKRQRGVLENFKRDHPVTFNVLVSVATLLAGFVVGGGLQGGRA